MGLIMFENFYALYPRKISGKDARKAWDKMKPADQVKALNAIPMHVAYWKLSGTEKEFIPYPASWLRAERWDDEIEMPQVAVPKEQAWWTSEQGMIQKGRELGTEPQPGESWDKFKARLTVKMRSK